ncbi:hypothetical protein E2C01_075301 [Portunus trituberculatus]|uniref:Uncharacterized protein n=1 Tax=Portunus trituberculatus TaxID=210409 RepID=A0A5B7IEM7_PORTR|nr:hypothetical protein [Portunus trituberculatus]
MREKIRTSVDCLGCPLVASSASKTSRKTLHKIEGDRTEIHKEEEGECKRSISVSPSLPLTSPKLRFSPLQAQI